MGHFERMCQVSNDLNQILDEIEYLRKRNAYLENEVRKYREWQADLVNTQQQLVGQTIKDIIKSMNEN